MGPAWRPRATQPLGVMLSAATPSPEWLTRHPGPELALRCSELSPGELPVLLASPQTGGSSRCRFVDDRMPRATLRRQVSPIRRLKIGDVPVCHLSWASHWTREDRYPSLAAGP